MIEDREGAPVVLTETKTLDVYDTQSGALLHTWPLGVVYSVNTYRFGSNPKRAGTLIFEPTAKVLATIRRN